VALGLILSKNVDDDGYFSAMAKTCWLKNLGSMRRRRLDLRAFLGMMQYVISLGSFVENELVNKPAGAQAHIEQIGR
jgi:hypothetical protein